MIFCFSEELGSSCYHRCMSRTAIRRTGGKAHFCYVTVGLKEFTKLFTKGGDLLNTIIPDTPEKWNSYFKESIGSLNALFKNCHSKCKFEKKQKHYQKAKPKQEQKQYQKPKQYPKQSQYPQLK